MSKFEPAIKTKRWKSESEEEILDLWFDEDAYAFNPESKKTIYTVDTPPPYLSGPIHMGNVIHYTQ
ncbi:MAG: class I tRNA ligase family protein, partial [Candidatus Thorarchaeota archaeon]